MKKAVRRTLNETTRQVRADVSRAVKDERDLPAAFLKENVIHVEKNMRGRHWWRWRVSIGLREAHTPLFMYLRGKKTPVSHRGKTNVQRKRSRSIKVRIKRGKTEIRRDLFIADVKRSKSGLSRGVFRRKPGTPSRGAGRSRSNPQVVHQVVPPPHHVLARHRVRRPIEDSAKKRLANEFGRQLRYYLSRMGVK